MRGRSLNAEAQRRFFGFSLRLCASAIALLALLTACSQAPELPVYGQVPRFHLTSQSGEPFDSTTLHGKVWIADFIYTTCPGPCPRMSSQMKQLQTVIPDATLVSFTVDPERDTPVVLAAYARRFSAQPGRWYLLTGDSATLQMLDRDAFKLGNIDGSMNHSTRFVLVDRQGRIRGYYGSSDEDAVKQVARDVRRLARS